MVSITLFDLALGEEFHLLAHRLGLHLQLGVQLQIDRGVDGAAHIGPDHDAAVAAHQAGAALAELLRKIAALVHGADQQVGVAELGVLVPDRHLVADGGAHVHQRPHLVPGDAVGNDARAVIVDHRHHVGPRLIGAAVDRALGVEVLALGVDRLAFEIELDDVVALDALGRPRARQEKAIRPVGMADADVAERIDDPELRQHVVRGHEVFQQVVKLRHGGVLPLN